RSSDLLIKGGAALEQLGKVQTVAFDKTGTLTKGKPEVTNIIALNGWQETPLLEVVGAIEMGSSHPLAVSLVNRAKQLGVALPEATEKQTLVGSGVRGNVAGEQYQVSAPGKLDIDLDEEIMSTVEALESEGKTDRKSG
ncbi:HAD family hydrolase, partial [Vibrio genomosp. F10]|uniref:HAD family hydrolase n=1 Tax=Vibrio genomosp. F10 TaxID=723171 RepID=UPI00114D0978